MPDQLLLDLSPSAPRLPSTIRPMLARPAAEPFDSSDHLFEPSWGGHRALAFVEPDPATGALGLRLLDAAGRDVAALFPELGRLPEALAAAFVVLDGEVIVPDGSGHCNAKALRERLAGAGPAGEGRRPGMSGERAGGRRGTGRGGAAPETGAGAVYLAFDILYSEGRPLVAVPLARRRQILASLVAPTPEILVVPAIPGEGRALFEAAVTQRLPGILGRHARGPYLAGRRSTLWRSVSTRSARIVRPDGGEVPPGEVRGQPDGRAVDEPAEGAGSRPLLALIRKLPLPLDD